MRRRGAGLVALDRHQQTQAQFRQVGQAMAQTHLQQMRGQMEVFRQQLREFAQKHRKKIERDAVFRAQFQRMCGAIGVDPLMSSKGFFAEVLGVGDFYYDLGVQVVQACLATRATNGGLMDMTELRRRVEEMRRHSGSAAAGEGEGGVSEDDVERAIRLLRPLGGGFGVVEVGGGRRLVQSVPHELSQDEHEVMRRAQQQGGRVTMREVKQQCAWDADRIQRAFQSLVRDGVLWLDATDHSHWALCLA